MPGGRPSPIDKIIGTREDGTPVTVASRIESAIRVGVFQEQAALDAGITKETFYEWLRVAGLARIRTGGNLDDPSLTAHEQRCIAFSDSVAAAAASWDVASETILEQVSRGGLAQEVITVKIEDGEEVERTVRTTKTLPDARVLLERKKRRFPHLYGDRIELSGPGGGPIELSHEDRASALLVLARSFREQQKPPKRARSAVGSGAPEVEESADGSGPAV